MQNVNLHNSMTFNGLPATPPVTPIQHVEKSVTLKARCASLHSFSYCTDQWTAGWVTVSINSLLRIVYSVSQWPAHGRALCHPCSPADTSFTECLWVRCCHRGGRTFWFYLSRACTRAHARKPLFAFWAVSLKLCDIRRYIVECTHQAGGQSPCEHLSVASDALWWRPEGKNRKRITIDT